MSLARMETTVAINALLDRLPDLHLDPTVSEPVINDVAFRSPAALPVEFTPA
jgi:cytochrome P450